MAVALVASCVNRSTKSRFTAVAPVQFGQQIAPSIQEAFADDPVNCKNLVNVFAP